MRFGAAKFARDEIARGARRARDWRMGILRVLEAVRTLRLIDDMIVNCMRDLRGDSEQEEV